MSDSLVTKTELLCAEAWRAVEATPQFAAFKALELALKALKGSNYEAKTSDLDVSRQRWISHFGASRSTAQSRKLTQGNAAELVLKESGWPLHVAELAHLVQEKGASLGGQRPLVSFTSMLSKDDRFISLRKDRGYFWWLSDLPLPQDWNEAEQGNSQIMPSSASSVPLSLKGGDGHDPATT